MPGQQDAVVSSWQPMDTPLLQLALAARRPARLRAGMTVPRIEVDAPPVRDPARLRALRAQCGLAPAAVLPPTGPMLLATPLLLRLLAHAAFPLRPMGLVHLAQRFDLLHAVRDDAALALALVVDGHRDLPAGQAIDVHATARVDGAVVWRGVSTLLARRPRDPDRPRETDVHDAGDAGWTDTAGFAVPTDIGRRYARLSGDRNPIHLWSITARPFGFRTAIAHGLWTLARTLATVDPTGTARHVGASFGAPLPLPSRVSVRWRADGTATVFEVSPATGGRAHLQGRCAQQPDRA